MTRRTMATGLIALVVHSGCGEVVGDGPTVCTTELRAGIVISVVDGATGNPIACGAHAVIAADGFVEDIDNTRQPCDDRVALAGAYERPGTYSVAVSRAGYYDLTVSGVIVAAGTCHVATAIVDARMQAVP